MLYLQTKLKASGSIIAINSNHKEIVVVDNRYTIFIYSLENLELIRQLQISANYETRHIYEKSFSISSNFDIFISLPNTPKGYLLKYSSKIQKVADITYNEKPHTTTKFHPNGRLLALGDEGGRLLLYDLEYKRLIGSLKAKPDYISSIAFSNNEKFMAVSAFNKTTAIYDLERCEYLCEFFQSDVAEALTFSRDDNSIIGVCRNLKAFKYDILKKELIISDFKFSHWPTSIILIGEDFSIVGIKGSSLYLIRNSDLYLEYEIKLDRDGVTSLLVVEKYLIVTFIDGEIEIFNRDRNLVDMMLALRLDKFKEATELIKQNILLITTEYMKKYDDTWSDTIQKAKDLLANGLEKEAKEIVEPFFIDRRKEDEFLFCLGNINDFMQFREYVNKKDFVKAFVMVDEKEFLKKTDEYKLLEKEWNKLYQNAKSILYLGNSQDINRAKEILRPFVVVKSKSENIKNLLTKHTVFIKADKFIKERNFKDYFLLVKDNGFLEKEDIYSRVLLIGNQTFSKMKLLEHQDNLDEAIKVAEYLKVFLPLKERVEESLKVLKSKKDVLERISQNEIRAVYAIVYEVKEIAYFKPFIEFNRIFLGIKNSAMKLAQNGEAKEAKALIKPYLSIPYLSKSISQVMKIAYLKEIENIFLGHKSDTISIDTTFVKYVKLYGVDEDILIVARLILCEDYFKENSEKLKAIVPKSDIFDYPDTIIER